MWPRSTNNSSFAFECKLVERLWTSVGMNIARFIMCGCMDGNSYGNNIVITLVCFFMYKNWLICSLDVRRELYCSFENVFSMVFANKKLIITLRKSKFGDVS